MATNMDNDDRISRRTMRDMCEVMVIELINKNTNCPTYTTMMRPIWLDDLVDRTIPVNRI